MSQTTPRFDPADAGALHAHFAELVGHARECPLPTPYALYSAHRLRRNLEGLRSAAADSRLALRVHLAVKSAYVPQVLATVARGCEGLDIQSHRELELCLVPVPISFHSPLLSEAAVSDSRVEQISVNTEAQYQKLEQVLGEGLRRKRLGFRIALPQMVDGQFVSQASKFGMPLEAAARLLQAHANQSPPPFIHHHTHARLSSGDEAITVARRFVQEVKRLQDLAGVPVRSVDIGGGWDGGYRLAASGTSLERLVHTQLRVLAENLPALEDVIVEPGRALIEDAGVVVTTVQELIPSEGTVFAVVDVATNFLVTLPLARFAVAPLEPLQGGEETHYTLVDGTCSPRGQLVSATWKGRLRVGDRLVIANCGAYTYSVASRFHSDPPPAFLLEKSGVLVDAFSGALHARTS